MQRKKTLHIILLLLVACCACAQRVDGRKRVLEGIERNHFGYISCSTGYTSLSGSLPNASFNGRWGGMIGLGYEFQIYGAWVNLGLQLTMHNATITPNNEVYHFKGIDTQGKPATFHYAVNQADALNFTSIDLPVLLGYCTHGFHIGAGVKLGYTLNALTTTNSAYSLSATYDEYGATFSDMPEHGYTTYPVHTTQKLRLPFGVNLIGEAGYDVLSSVQQFSKVKQVLKVGLYFEYGLTSILSNNDTPLSRFELLKPGEDATQAAINPYLSTLSKSNRIVPFMVGIKICYMIGTTKR